MGSNGLEFEAPLRELEKKIAELENFQANKGYDLQQPIARLQEQMNRTAKEIYSGLSPWQKVMVARHLERPTTADYVEKMCTDFVELHGDRAFRDDKAIIAGFAKLDGRPAMVIGQQRGRTTKERLACNWGMSHPEGYRKALRMMRLAEHFNVPVVTLIDTAGAYPGIEAEERGQPHAISQNLVEMLKIKVPIVAVIIGEGGSGGALGICVGNKLCMLEHSTFSVISPEGCSSILFRTAEKRQESARALKLTAQDLSALGIIDEVVEEPLPAAHWDHRAAADNLKEAILRNLDKLAPLSQEEIVTQRRAKYRNIGMYLESA